MDISLKQIYSAGIYKFIHIQKANTKVTKLKIVIAIQVASGANMQYVLLPKKVQNISLDK